jgi:glutathione S-transferase
MLTSASILTWCRRVTLADFSAVAPLFYIKEAELPVAPYPHLRDWFARVSGAAGLARHRPNAGLIQRVGTGFSPR